MKTKKKFFPTTTLLMAVLILLFTSLPAIAQNVGTCKAWITLIDGAKVKGTFYAANEDGLVIHSMDFKKVNLNPETIEVIKLRRSGRIGRGAWIGAATGLFLGALVGYATTDDDEFLGRGYGAAGGGVVGLPAGAVLGVAIGAARKKFVVKGDEGVYKSMLPELQKYVPK